MAVPRSCCFILLSSIREVTFQSKDGRTVSGEKPEDAPSWTEYSSTCTESRTAFNLIWVYLHKSPLNLHVRDLGACVQGPYTSGQSGAQEISTRPEIDWGREQRDLRNEKRVGNRNEIFCFGMKRSRVRLTVSSFVYISRIPGIRGKSEFTLRSLRWRPKSKVDHDRLIA